MHYFHHILLSCFWIVWKKNNKKKRTKDQLVSISNTSSRFLKGSMGFDLLYALIRACRLLLYALTTMCLDPTAQTECLSGVYWSVVQQRKGKSRFQNIFTSVNHSRSICWLAHLQGQLLFRGGKKPQDCSSCICLDKCSVQGKQKRQNNATTIKKSKYEEQTKDPNCLEKK